MPTTIAYIGELSRDGVFIFEPATIKFTYINNPFARIFGIPKSSIMDQPRILLPFIHSEDSDHLRKVYEQLKVRKSILDTEFILHFFNGTIKHLLLDAYLIDEGNLICGFVRDVTREKEHQDYIVNYGAKKDTLLDMMSHNLFGPLTLSRNILNWMQVTYKENMPYDIYSQLHLLESNTQECLEIINDFLREEHMESERIYVKKSRFDILERISVTLEKLIATNRNKKFRFITKLQHLYIHTDSVKFFQIVHNLVSNAIKFTPDNGEIDIIVEETEKTFIIRVKDNGIGIPAHLQERLFEKRTPAGRKGLNKEETKGMGLYIVKTLTHLLQGKVQFETEENKGSTFSVELPKE